MGRKPKRDPPEVPLITRSLALALRSSSERFKQPRVILPRIRHRKTRLELGNYLTGVSLTLPIHLDTPAEIIREIQEQTARIKRDHLAEGYTSLNPRRLSPLLYRETDIAMLSPRAPRLSPQTCRSHNIPAQSLELRSQRTTVSQR